MEHVMIDLETLGTTVNAPIVSIGAVEFNPNTGELGSAFYQIVRLESSLAYGGKVDADTLRWWLTQNIEVKKETFDPINSKDLEVALRELDTFIFDRPIAAQVWGNGAAFDLGILKNNYEKLGLAIPWMFYKERDMRTIVELGHAINCIPNIPFNGTKHNALDDAIHQAQVVSIIWQTLMKRED